MLFIFSWGILFIRHQSGNSHHINMCHKAILGKSMFQELEQRRTKKVNHVNWFLGGEKIGTRKLK